MHAALHEDVENTFIHKQQMLLHDGMMKKVFSRVNSEMLEQFRSTLVFLCIRSNSEYWYLHCTLHGMISNMWKTIDGLMNEALPNFSIP